jgi:hypothetical protein
MEKADQVAKLVADGKTKKAVGQGVGDRGRFGLQGDEVTTVN